MADEKKKKKNVFQKIAAIAKDFAEWVEETFGDPELAAEIKDDLGLNPNNPATPTPTDPQAKKRLDDFAAKQDIDEAALLEVVAAADRLGLNLDDVRRGVTLETVFFELTGRDLRE